MLYATRRADGTIETLSRSATPGATLVDPAESEVQQFIERSPGAAFNESDAELVRVIEDLIDTLISKNVIRHTDLPAAAQRKLSQRKGMRSRLAGALDFFGKDERLL